MRRWDSLASNYIRECESRGLAEATIKIRHWELDKFGAWVKRQRQKVNLEAINGEILIKYVRSRSVCHGKSTIHGILSNLRGMGEFLVREGLWQKNPLKWIKGPRLDPGMRLPKRIGRERLQRIWKQAINSRHEYTRKTMMAVLAILYGTGLRRGELERLDLEDWNRQEALLRIDGRKTGWERTVPVGGAVWKCIEAYLPYRHNRLEKTGKLEETALLVNRFGERLSGIQIGKSIHGLAKRAGIKLVSVHQFRHTCASDLLEEGTSSAEVQKILGHRHISSTLRYSHVADPQRRQAIENHPINTFINESKTKQ